MEYLLEAKKRGIPEVCFSDHMPSVNGYDPKHRMSLDQYGEYIHLLEEVKSTSPIPVITGVEADFYPGCEPVLEELISVQELDLVLGSIHFLNGWGFDDPDQLPVWKLVDIEDTWERYFALLERLVDSGLFDVVAHMDLPKKFGHRPDTSFIKALAEPVLDRIALKGMALEVNTSGLRKPVGEVYPSREILLMAKERDIPICLGSDAHSPKEVGWMFEGAIQLLKELGFRHHVRFKNRKGSLYPLP
jgi:histidinol-phosphatase (PHP family)